MNRDAVNDWMDNPTQTNIASFSKVNTKEEANPYKGHMINNATTEITLKLSILENFL